MNLFLSVLLRVRDTSKNANGSKQGVFSGIARYYGDIGEPSILLDIQMQGLVTCST